MDQAQKVDHFRLCNEHNIPFQDFTIQFCNRCLQPECTRSQHGKSKFEDRVANWHERLFAHPNRLDPTDPRFKDLASKKFLPILPGSPSGPSAWMDPREIESQKVTVPVAQALRTSEKTTNEIVTRYTEVLQRAPEPMPPEPPSPPPTANPPTYPQLQQNTPSLPRQMIGGGDPKPPSPVLDPWQPMQPLKPGERLVKPGARIKLGS